MDWVASANSNSMESWIAVNLHFSYQLNVRGLRPDAAERLLAESAVHTIGIRYGTSPHTENLEEHGVEALRFTLLVGCALPCVGECGNTGTNFVPR